MQIGRSVQQAISNASSAVVAATGQRTGAVASAVQTSGASETSYASVLSPLLGLSAQQSPPTADKTPSAANPEHLPSPATSSCAQPLTSSPPNQQCAGCAPSTRDDACPTLDAPRHTEEPGSEAGQPGEETTSRPADTASSLQRSSPSVCEGDSNSRTTRRAEDASALSPSPKLVVGSCKVPAKSRGNGGGRQTQGSRVNPYVASYYQKEPGATYRHRVGASTACCSLLSSPCAPSLRSSPLFVQPIPQRQMCRTQFDRMGLAEGRGRVEEVENSWFFIDIYGGDSTVGRGAPTDTQCGTPLYPVDEARSAFTPCIAPASSCDRQRSSDGKVQGQPSADVVEDGCKETTWKGLKAEDHQELRPSSGAGVPLPSEGRGVVTMETKGSCQFRYTGEGRDESLVNIENRSSGLVRINDPSEIGADASLLASTLSSELIDESQAGSLAADEERIDTGALPADRSLSRTRHPGAKVERDDLEAHAGSAERGANNTAERDLSAGNNRGLSIASSLRRLFEKETETQEVAPGVNTPNDTIEDRAATEANTERDDIRFLDLFLTPLSPEEKLLLAARSATGGDVRDVRDGKQSDDAFQFTDPVTRSPFPSTFFPALTARSFLPHCRYTMASTCPENTLGGSIAGYWKHGTANLTRTVWNRERDAGRRTPGRHSRALEGVTFHVPAEDAEDFLAVLEESLPYSWHDIESAVVEGECCVRKKGEGRKTTLKPLTALVVGRLVFVQLPSFLFEFLATTESAAAAAAATAEAVGVSAAGLLPSLCSFASCLIIFGGCVYALVRGAKALHMSRRAQLLTSMKTEEAAERGERRKHDDCGGSETYFLAERAERGEAGVEEGTDAFERVKEKGRRREAAERRDVNVGVTTHVGEEGIRNPTPEREEFEAESRRDTEGKHEQKERGWTKSVAVIRRDPERKWKEEAAVRAGVCSEEWRGCFSP
ncbi:hypothetical protein NCLIV_033280 [Neospora caninum Liverpool]|uniref:Transmembrane protein n=1 Tax=Neospora caninum (strain Liverpool) TaxID=572307 RepID=F0VII0_NEOCL|nr:hypothetical protein NCLIV_033280 [Neospora caninum Liverpool]CBZ53541.1 hypothetical protein NCLIV_033280 [Neospora caninum Liverpool]|eukprot:XP_003883573.1 hypothetical protein NCLIV_033280 [Neospora caninum Liverpool]